MIKRPLLVAAAGFCLTLYIFKSAGFPVTGIPAEQKEVRECIDAEESVHITGLIYQRAEKENSIQYYIKKSVLLSNTDRNINSIAQIPVRQNIIIISSKENQSNIIPIGSEIQVQGELKEIPAPGNPGQFDSATYYKSRKIAYTMWAEKVEVLKAKHGWKEMAERLREHLAGRLSLMLPKRHAGVMIAMLLGDKSYGEAETRVNYQMGGALHILSISGLHLSLLGMGCYRLLCRMRLPNAASIVAAGVLMSIYCWFTGNNVATLRALIMFFVSLGARLSGRSYDPLSSISLSMILLLAENPQYLFYSGFQLSYVAVLGAGVIYPIWRDWMRGKQAVRTFMQKFKRLLKDGILSCTVITLTTLPLTCYYFYEIPLLGLIPNLLMMATMNFVMLPGMLGMCTGAFSQRLGKIILLPVWGILESYEILMRIIRKIPWAVYICGQPQIWQILIYYAILMGITCFIKILMWKQEQTQNPRKLPRPHKNKKRRIYHHVCNLILLIAAAGILLWRKPVEACVTVLDVGQGDSIVLQGEGHCFLVDGGSISEKEVGEYRILPFLKSQGIRKLDGIIVTHPDEDHINGILELLEKVQKKETALRVRQLFLPLWMKGGPECIKFVKLAEELGIPVHYLQKGDRIEKGELKLEVLHPDRLDYTDEKNAGSITLGVHYRKLNVLLTGDIEGSGEGKLIQEAGTYEFLKVAHHGSKNSTSSEFLDKTAPRIAVISCGRQNPYGHPHKELLKRLEEQQAAVFTTAACGAVTICQKDGDCYLSSFIKDAALFDKLV